MFSLFRRTSPSGEQNPRSPPWRAGSDDDSQPPALWGSRHRGALPPSPWLTPPASWECVRNVPRTALLPTGCVLAPSHHICYLHGCCSQKRVVTQGNLFTDSRLAFKQGALKPVKSGKQTVSLFWGTFPLWVCKGFLWEASSLLDSWAWLLACWKATLSLEKSLFQGIQFSEVQDEFTGGGGSRRWGRCTIHGLMYTARSISWTLLVVAIGMRRLLILNHRSSGVTLKNVTGFLLFTTTSFLNQGSFKNATQIFTLPKEVTVTWKKKMSL